MPCPTTSVRVRERYWASGAFSNVLDDPSGALKLAKVGSEKAAPRWQFLKLRLVLAGSDRAAIECMKANTISYINVERAAVAVAILCNVLTIKVYRQLGKSCRAVR